MSTKFFKLFLIFLFGYILIFGQAYSSDFNPSEEQLRGLEIAQKHCSRCHVVSKNNRYGGIESTPSFFGLRNMKDWEERFQEFFVRPPHPSFVNIKEVTEERSDKLPAFITEINLTLEQVDEILSYVSIID